MKPLRGSMIWLGLALMLAPLRSVAAASPEAATPELFTRCDIQPRRVQPGQPVRLEIESPFRQARDVEVRVPHFVASANVSPTLTYDEKTHTAWLMENGSKRVTDNGPLDRDPRPGRLSVQLETRGVTPGLCFLTVNLKDEAGKALVTRHLGFVIASPRDQLQVEVSPPQVLHDGIISGRFTRMKDGTLVLDKMISTDSGRTWTKPPGGGMVGGCYELSDGRILNMSYRCLPIEGRPGWYEADQTISRDGSRTVERRRAEFHVPQAKAAMGHAPHKGPLFTASLVEIPKGRLVALMMGWFKGDDAPCPHSSKRPYSRTYVCESTDGGATWQYLSTIGYDHIGSEGYNEGAIAILPTGELGAVMRTGNMADAAQQDNPVMFATSRDGGRSWSKPRRVGINGAYPDLKVLDDGTLVISSGRPGAYVTFSRDGGQTWGDVTLVDPSPFAGYSTIVGTAPGELLIAYSEGYINPKAERNVVCLARIRYKDN